MKLSTRSICTSLISAPVIRIAALAITASSAQAATFNWDGSTDTWPSIHWLDSGSVLVAGGTGAAITDTYTINSGTVNFTDHDTFDAAAANPLLTINVNGGTLSNEAAAFGQAFTTLGLVNLTGGTITSTGGANSSFQAFQLKNTVTSSGASFINTTGTPANFNGFHVTNNIFNVTDGTLTVSAPLINAAGGAAAGFTKTGAGIMTLSGVNAYTGNTIVTGGTLDIAAGGTVTNAAKINTQTGGVIAISGTVSMAVNANFGIGSGLTGTTGFVTVNNGGVLTIGTGSGGTVGYTAVGGSDSGGGGQKGRGNLTINAGGTVNVAAGGTGPGGLDGSSLWINPYGQTGSSSINLDGGTLSTARPVQDGAGGGAAVFNFNGGTLKAAAGIDLLTLAANVRNGGATVDSNGLNPSIGGALVHSAIGGDNVIDGGLTKTGNGTLTMANAGSTYNGNVAVNAGTLLLGGAANTPTPVATALGNMMEPGRTITVASGATLQFGSNDTIGGTTAPATGASFIVNGGTLSRSNAIFTTIGNVTLNSGATMTGGNGVFAGFESWVLRGAVTVGGTSGSTITTSGSTLTGIHLGVNGTNVFDVGATGSAVDLTVSAPLINRPDNNGGAGVLQKTGAGTMVLGAANLYTGTTSVAAGTLIVTGSISGSDVQVESGATIGGTGTAKTLWVKSGGIFAPGTSIGTFTAGGGDMLLEGISNFEISKTGLSLAADLAVSSTSVIFGGTLNVAHTGDALASGDMFNLFDAPDLGANAFSAINLPSLSGDLTWDTTELTVDGTITVVPEPGSTALLLAGLGMLARRRRQQP